MFADLIPTVVVLCGAGGVLSTLVGWALGCRPRPIPEVCIEIGLAQAEHEADQLRAELTATRIELAAMRAGKS